MLVSDKRNEETEMELNLRIRMLCFFLIQLKNWK